MKRLFYCFLLFTLGVFTLGIFQFRGHLFAAPQEELLSIYVLPFHNSSGRSEHDYLASSISGSIEENLDKKFQYHRVSSKKVNRSLTEILKKQKNTQLTQQDIRRLASKVNIDFLIYGDYRISKSEEGSDDIKIKTYAYIKRQFLNIHLLDTSSKVDSGIFSDIQEMGLNLVFRIQKLARFTKELIAGKAFIHGRGRGLTDDSPITDEVQAFKKYTHTWYGVDIPILEEYLENNENISVPSATVEKVSDDKVHVPQRPQNISFKKLANWANETIKVPYFIALEMTNSRVNIQLLHKGKQKYQITYPRSIMNRERELEWGGLIKHLKHKGKRKVPKKLPYLGTIWETSLAITPSVSFRSNNSILTYGFLIIQHYHLLHALHELKILHPPVVSLFESMLFGFSLSGQYAPQQHSLNQANFMVSTNGLAQTYSFGMHLGYFYKFLQDYRILGEFYGGYSLTSLSASIQITSPMGISSEGGSRNIIFSNPYVGVRLNLEYALFQFISLGFFLDYQHRFSSSSEPIDRIGGALYTSLKY